MSAGESRCMFRTLRRFLAREGGDRLRPVPDAASISISTINRSCGL
jgi:hypothetical protein